MEDMYMAMAEPDLETPLLGVFEQPSRVWNFFSSFWSGNNAEPILIVPPDAVEMGSINELPVSTQRLFQAASEELWSSTCRRPRWGKEYTPFKLRRLTPSTRST